MTKNITLLIYVLIMITVVVIVDLTFFRDRFWERLLSDIGIVLIFIAFYLRFLR